ncbi:MAG: hypothetical protein GWO08_22620, partial [Gammaproteobacteria bacterium]|nr:hypothetical protein [Gammaproteobacteria bacterium]
MKPLSFTQLKLIALLIVTLAGVLSIYIPQINYRSEITDYFEQDNREVIRFKKLETNFGLQQSLLILLQQHDDTFVSPSGVNRLYTIINSIESLDGIDRTQSMLSTAISVNQDTRSLYSHLKQG